MYQNSEWHSHFQCYKWVHCKMSGLIIPAQATTLPPKETFILKDHKV